MSEVTKKETPVISVVMPCLNEEKGIRICIEKAKLGIAETGYSGEIIVSDNGSTDNSVQIAYVAGARVVQQPKKGYGNAYLKGLEEASGKYIVIGDSDTTYDFGEIPRFIKHLEEGYDFVNGSRLRGEIKPGAMPWLHRYIGVPLLSGFLNLLFSTSVSDAHCGLRAFTSRAYEKMDLKSTGMEFASEMIISAGRNHLKIKEVPITYYPREGASKLNTFRDGWRHLVYITTNRLGRS